ncbi:CELA1 elastase, partial [Bucorvus abyssinicus]|nr:CELA1 elastase [Bucorvus abyssinicus]
GYYSPICGGTLISGYWVMTQPIASACEPPGARYQVALGEHDLLKVDGIKHYIDVDRVFIHEGWNPSEIVNGDDIALLRLTASAYDNGFIEIGVLPSEGDILPNDHFCYITGWGAVSGKQGKGGAAVRTDCRRLCCRWLTMRSAPRKTGGGSQVKTSMICAGGDGVKARCSGDSRGPLNCYRNNRWEVHGIVSFGLDPYCNIYKKPTVFTRVSAYVDWI